MVIPKTLCVLAGFKEENVRIVQVPHRLCFRSELDAGRFVYKMHALTLLPGDDVERASRTLASLKRHLPLEHNGGTYVLHYDEKGVIAFK